MSITVDDINKHFARIVAAIEKDATTPDTMWLPKGELRKLGRQVLLREDLQKIIDDESIPDNCIIQVLKQP